MPSLAIFFLLCLSMHACINARRLGFVAQEIGNHVGLILSNKVGPSVPKELQTEELQEVGVHGRRTQENLIGANTMKQILLISFLKAKESVAKAISGYEIIISSGVDLQGVEKVEGLKRVTRSMLGNAGGDTEKAVDYKEKDKLKGDIDVMDYAQPHRKPPIHNEKN
ncbi:hypothetical protein DITRI_Ditri04bG0108700 [Diplodiscus trichospermus]